MIKNKIIFLFSCEPLDGPGAPAVQGGVLSVEIQVFPGAPDFAAQCFGAGEFIVFKKVGEQLPEEQQGMAHPAGHAFGEDALMGLTGQTDPAAHVEDDHLPGCDFYGLFEAVDDVGLAVLALDAHFLGLQDAAAVFAGLGKGLAVEHVLGDDFLVFPVFIAGVFDFFKLIGVGFYVLLKVSGF